MQRSPAICGTVVNKRSHFRDQCNDSISIIVKCSCGQWSLWKTGKRRVFKKKPDLHSGGKVAQGVLTAIVHVEVGIKGLADHCAHLVVLPFHCVFTKLLLVLGNVDLLHLLLRDVLLTLLLLELKIYLQEVAEVNIKKRKERGKKEEK